MIFSYERKDIYTHTQRTDRALVLKDRALLLEDRALVLGNRAVLKDDRAQGKYRVAKIHRVP